jgi:uncharacterized protein YjhX (UPF0386 family)
MTWAMTPAPEGLRAVRLLQLFSKAFLPMPNILIGASRYVGNVSRSEQRVLHALAQGASIRVEKDDKGKIVEVICVTREGWILSDCTLSTFRSLKHRHMIGSQMGGPYRITKAGLVAVRGQPDNR